MKLSLSLLIILGFTSANAYDLNFAVEDGLQKINRDYNELVEFQPIIDTADRSAALYLPGTQDDIGVKAFARLVESRKNGNLVYSLLTEDNNLEFNAEENSDQVIELGKDNCGVSTVVATKDLGATKITFTLSDYTEARCNLEDMEDTWQVILMIEDNDLRFIQRLQGSPDRL